MEGFQIWQTDNTMYCISNESLNIHKRRRKPEPGDTEYYRRIWVKLSVKPKCFCCGGKIVFNELNLLYCTNCKQDYYLNPKEKVVYKLNMEEIENDRLSSKEKRKNR